MKILSALCVGGLLAAPAAAILVAPAVSTIWHHPHDIIDTLALSPTFSSDHTLFATSDGTLNVVARSVNGGFTWSDVRSGLTGKHVYAMVMADDFATSGRAYAAMGGDGMAVSGDHGTTWRPALTNRDIRHLVGLPFSADAAPTLFFASHAGVFRCGDPAKGDVELDPARFKTSPPVALAAARGADGNAVVFVACADGRVHRSADAGATWTTLGQYWDVRNLVPSPAFAKDSTLWMATFGGGVLLSRDRGDTFTATNTGLTDLFVNDVAVPAHWPECQELFVATKDEGVFHSKDGGAHWLLTPLKIEKTYQTTNHHKFVRLPADYPKVPVVYCGTFEGLHFSTDGGEHWMKSNVNPTRFGRRIVLSPDYVHDKTLFTSGYGMLLSTSTDAGDSWTFGAVGVRALSTYGLAVSPTWKDDGLEILGINEGIWRSADRGKSWTKLDLPPFKRPPGPRQDHDITQIVFSPDYANDHVVYAVSFGGVYVSHDAAVSFKCLAPVIEWGTQLALSPDFPRDHIVFVGGGRMKRSADGGETWSPELVNYPVSGIVCAPDWSATGEVYAWSGFVGFSKSINRGQTWKLCNEGLEGHRPTDVDLAPNFAANGTMFMTTFGGGLFRSTDRGAHWQRFGSRDPRLDHCSSLALSPGFDSDHTMYVGNFDGIWRSTDGGESFTLKTTHEIYDQAREPWLRTGIWGRPDRIGAFGGTIDDARHKGNTASIPFVGNSVRLRGTRGPNHGRFNVFLDDKVVKTVDAYAEKPEDSAVLFESDVPWGYHILTVLVLGEKSDASSDVVIGVDAAEVGCVGPEGDVPVFSRYAAGETALRKN